MLRHIFLLETENDKDGMFVMNVNGTKLHLGLKEFVAVTGLKCGPIFDFVSVPIKIIHTNFIRI